MLFKACDISKSYGGVTAVKNASVEFSKNEITGIIGSNGAGKTTLFNILTGFTRSDSGKIIYEYKGKPVHIEKYPPYMLARMGIGRTFQNIRLFNNLSVLQNVEISLKACGKKTNEAEKILKRVFLFDKINNRAGSLTYGEQKNLELARCIATMGNIVFLDEPAAGMNSKERLMLIDIIKNIRLEFGLSIVIIEHDMSFVSKLCSNIYVMDLGEIIAYGKPSVVLKDPNVTKAIMGEA